MSACLYVRYRCRHVTFITQLRCWGWLWRFTLRRTRRPSAVFHVIAYNIIIHYTVCQVNNTLAYLGSGLRLPSLQLNPSKWKFIWFGSRSVLSKYHSSIALSSYISSVKCFRLWKYTVTRSRTLAWGPSSCQSKSGGADYYIHNPAPAWLL